MSDGCKCSQCHSLREYMLKVTGKDYGLRPAPGHAPLPDPCDGSMTCSCHKCESERSARLKVVRIRQPWEPRPVEITDSLHMATVQLEKAQNALIYELGQAERVRRAKP